MGELRTMCGCASGEKAAISSVRDRPWIVLQARSDVQEDGRAGDWQEIVLRASRRQAASVGRWACVGRLGVGRQGVRRVGVRRLNVG